MKPTQQKLTKGIEGWYETEQYNAIGLSQLFHQKKKKKGMRIWEYVIIKRESKLKYRRVTEKVLN